MRQGASPEVREGVDRQPSLRRIAATHVGDALLAGIPRGLRWQARPVGSGVLPIPGLPAPRLKARADLALSIELHPRSYHLPIHDPTWLAFFPAHRPESLAAVVRLADRCEARHADGPLARPEAIEAIPWPDRDLDCLASSLGALRAVIEPLARLEGSRTAVVSPLNCDIKI